MSLRIKGQEVETSIIVNGLTVANLNDIRNFGMTLMIDRLEEEYLGQSSKQFDEIFNGSEFKFQLHYSTPDVFALASAVIDRARRRTPGTVINVKATLIFPAFGRVRVLLPNVFLGALPFEFGGRKEYGTMDISGATGNPPSVLA